MQLLLIGLTHVRNKNWVNPRKLITTMECYSQSNPFPRKTDGIEVLKVHKADEDLKNTPVVMLNSSQKAWNLTKYAVNTHVVKPVGVHRFVKAVSHLDFGRQSTKVHIL